MPVSHSENKTHHLPVTAGKFRGSNVWQKHNANRHHQMIQYLSIPPMNCWWLKWVRPFIFCWVQSLRRQQYLGKLQLFREGFCWACDSVSPCASCSRVDQGFLLSLHLSPRKQHLSAFFLKCLFLSSLIAALFLELSNELLKESTLNLRDANALSVILSSISFVKMPPSATANYFFLISLPSVNSQQTNKQTNKQINGLSYQAVKGMEMSNNIWI